MISAAVLAAAAAWLAFPMGRALSRDRWTLAGLRSSASERLPGRRRRRRDLCRAWVAAFASDLASEVRSGHQPMVGWRRLWLRGPFAGASGLTSEAVVEIMHTAARTPGGEGLVRIAACWEVAEQTGAGLADALDRVAEGLTAEREIVDEIEGQLAGPRATARLLVVLPLFALLLGRTLGADPIGVLLRTTYGWVCLAVGLALLAIGWRWTHAQVRRVSPWPDR